MSLTVEHVIARDHSRLVHFAGAGSVIGFDAIPLSQERSDGDAAS